MHSTSQGPSGPKYLEIRKRLLQQVQSGALAPGVALPKEQELATSLDVAVGTLRQALRGLERDGLIRRVRGKGTFVNSPEQRRARIKTNIFSLISPALREDPIPALIEGAEDVATRSGYRLMITSSDNEVTLQGELLRKAAETNVAGVLLVPATNLGTPDQVTPLRDRHIPIVFCNRRIPGVSAPLVTWPFIEVGRMATTPLLQQGHRRIGVLADFEDIFVDAAVSGVRQGMREHRVDTSGCKVLCYRERLRGEHARAAIDRVLKDTLFADDRPTAIMCFNAFDAELVYLLAGDMGLRIPRDLSLIYFGAQRRLSALAQRITCIGADECEIGVQACRLLDDMNAGLILHESNQTIEIPLVLLPGETIGSPARS